MTTNNSNKLVATSTTQPRGSRIISYDVTLNGQPFGGIWKFKDSGKYRSTWKSFYTDGRLGDTGYATMREALAAMQATL